MASKRSFWRQGLPNPADPRSCETPVTETGTGDSSVVGGACRPPPPDPRPAPAAQGELAGPTAVSASRCEPGTGLGSGVRLALPPGTASARLARARPHALVTRRADIALRECVGRAHRPYGNRKRRAELRHCLQGLLRWHPACTARAWGSKRFFTFGALPPDWLSAPRCDSTGCSGVFFWE